MVILLQQKNFGPNVIYFALGITEGRPAGAFWADKKVEATLTHKLEQLGRVRTVRNMTCWFTRPHF